jgi:hypothetical protein
MPFTPLSTAVLVCEKILHETDNVVSAIRIIDLFQIPEQSPEGSRVSAQLFVQIRCAPFSETYPLSVLLDKPGGISEQLLAQEIGPITPHPSDPTVPVGMVIAAQLSVRASLRGTYIVRLIIDQQEIARAHFTLLPRASPAA